MAYILIPGRFNSPPSGPVQLRRNSDILHGVQVATSPHGTGPRRLLDMLHGKTYQTVTGNGTKSATGSRGLGHVINSIDYFSVPFDPAKFSSGTITAVTHVSITASAGQRGYLHIGTSDKLTPRLLLQQSGADFNSYWAGAFRLASSGFFSDLSARAGFTYSSGSAAIYKAGKLANSGAHPAIDFAGATELWIGGGYDYPVTGTVGEMLIWNRALSAAEHAALAREWYGLIYEQNPRRVYVDMGAVVFDATPSGATVQGITATGATPKATVTRSGPSPVGTLYYVIYADGLGAPSSAQVKAGQNATGAAAVASGNEACRTTTGDQVFGTPASGLTASTAYRIAFVASDGTTDSAVAVSASAFTTLASAITLTGSSAQQAATASSGAVAQVHTLAGSSAQQAATTSSGAAAQVHDLVGSSAQQAAATSSGAVAQAHELTGSSAQQAATTSSGAVGSEGTLAGGTTSQAATTSSGAVAQAHELTGSSTQQAATTSSGAIGSEGTLAGGTTSQAATTSSGAVTQVHVLLSAAVAADSVASASAIVQEHLLAGSSVTQATTSTQGAIDLTFSHNLSGPATEQGATTSAGALTQTFSLSGASAQQSASTSQGPAQQVQTLAGSNTEQEAVTSSGAISQATGLAGGATSQAATTSSGAIDLSFAHTLTGASVEAPHTTSAGVVAQIHALLGGQTLQYARAPGGASYTDVLQLNIPLWMVHRLGAGQLIHRSDEGIRLVDNPDSAVYRRG